MSDTRRAAAVYVVQSPTGQTLNVWYSEERAKEYASSLHPYEVEVSRYVVADYCPRFKSGDKIRVSNDAPHHKGVSGKLEYFADDGAAVISIDQRGGYTTLISVDPCFLLKQ